jgi:two-component system, LytTR family, response regulator
MAPPKIRTLVVDDEPIARERMLSLLREHDDIELVGECANGLQAKDVIEAVSPDLLFLDIQMPEMNGMELARTIQSSGAAVVFVTAYDDYAVQAFEVHALDYLLKPFSTERLCSALGHAREFVARQRAGRASGRAVAPEPAGANRRNRLMIKSEGRIHFVRMAEIDWCEAAGNYVRVHAGTQRYLVRDTMSHLEAELDPQQFIRIHRSTIVNADRIQEMQSSFNGEYVVILRGGTRLTLSRSYRDAIQPRLGKTL